MASATSFAVREQPGAAGNTTEDFAALLDATLGADTGFAGSVVTGRVLRIDDDYAVVDVGLKSEGACPSRNSPPRARSPR
jgi:small subunit ribosomal protein S1